MHDASIKVSGKKIQVGPGCRDLNKDLFDLGAMGSPERKRGTPPELGHKLPPRQKGPCRLAVRITILSVRGDILDSDNLVAGNKPLRDAIANSINLNDGDPCIDWEYRQVQSAGQPGTFVKIETL